MIAMILSHSRTISSLAVTYPEHVSLGAALDKWGLRFKLGAPEDNTKWHMQVLCIVHPRIAPGHKGLCPGARQTSTISRGTLAILSK